MERIKRERTEGLLARAFPYLLAGVLVIIAEAIYFGARLPGTMLVFISVAMAALAAFLIRPYLSILALFAVKPLLDIMWGASVGGIKGLYIIGVLGPLIWFVGILYFRVPVTRYKMWRSMLFWGIICLFPLASSLLGGNVLKGANISLRFLNGWGFYFLLPFLVRDERDFKLLIYAWLLSAAIPGALGLFYAITGNLSGYQITLGFNRLKGPYHDAAGLMTEIGFCLPLLLYMLAGAKKRWSKGLWLLAIGLWMFLTFKTYTRIWWMGATAVMGFWLFFGLWQPFLMGIAGAGLQWKEILRRLTSSGLEDITSPGAFGGRERIWMSFYYTFVRRFSPLEKLVGGSWPGLRKSSFAIPNFHNQYLDIAANFGLIGLGTFLWLFVGFAYHLFKLMPLRKNDGVLGLSIVILFAVLCLTGTYLLIPNSQWYFFGFMGVLIHRMRPGPAPGTMQGSAREAGAGPA